MIDVALSRLDLDPSKPPRRSPPRPPALRQPAYEEQFDFLTVFYDCFTSADQRSVICLGPPLANLAPIVLPVIRRGFGRWLPARIAVRESNHLAEVRIATRRRRAALPSEAFVQKEIAVRPNHCDLFHGRRVLLSKTRDNELAWIRDWAHFFAAHHGCDAVLLYNNSKTGSDSGAIRDALAAVPGIAVALVIHWPFPFGPNGGPARIWDSDFCQYGALEHARHRFLAKAQAVVNADIDEFVVTSGNRSIFELASLSATGYLQYAGHWIENATLIDCEPRRHMHYIYRSTAPEVDGATIFDPELGNVPVAVQPKWAVVPSRSPATAQWRVHDINGMQPDRSLSALASIRHFKAINTNWKTARWRLERPDAQRHSPDADLLPLLQIFDDGETAPWRAAGTSTYP
jgi:hypothetical protein